MSYITMLLCISLTVAEFHKTTNQSFYRLCIL
nr:MAG TPA: hypothetical protein [Caudoviricetes sp.]